MQHLRTWVLVICIYCAGNGNNRAINITDASPISNPLKADGNVNSVIPDYFDFKRRKNYHSLTPDVSINAREVQQREAATGAGSTLPLTEFRLRWSTTVGSPIYATPVLFPSGPGGSKQIFVNTFYQYAELLNDDGYKPWGWPLSFEDASFQGSPLLYDVDGDENIDMGLVDRNGNLYWVRIGEYGEYLEDYHVQVPALKVKRDWSEGLDPQFVDSYVKLSMFDHHRHDHDGAAAGTNGGRGEDDVGEGQPSSSSSLRRSSKARTDSLQSMHRPTTTSSTGAGDNSATRYRYRRRLTEQASEGITLPLEGGGEEQDAEGQRADAGGSGVEALRGEEEKQEEEQSQQNSLMDTTTNSHSNSNNDNNNDNNNEHREKQEQVQEEGKPPPPPQVQEQGQEQRTKEETVEQETKHQDESVEPLIPDLQQEEEEEEQKDEGSGSEAAVLEHEGQGDAEHEGEEEEVIPDFGEDGMMIPYAEMMDDFIASEAQRRSGGAGLPYGADTEEEEEEEEAGGEEDSESRSASVDGREESEVSLEHMLGEKEGEGGGEEDGEFAAPSGSEHNYGYEYAYRMPAAPGGAHARARDYGAGYAYHANAGGGGGMGGFNDSEYVMVDAHVLASPVLVDVNGDGNMEILFSVSYYFDKAEYADKAVDFDPDLFVAGGVACWDLEEQNWSWMVHLDLTTAKSAFQAMIYASPTVADLDGDGRYEVIVGTALGLLYVLDGESGFVRRFFPMQFHSIQAQVAVADLLGDRALEMVVCDMGGTVAVVDLAGEVVWDAHLSGSLPFAATVGDVDGDGQLDVVVVAATDRRGRSAHKKKTLEADPTVAAATAAAAADQDVANNPLPAGRRLHSNSNTHSKSTGNTNSSTSSSGGGSSSHDKHAGSHIYVLRGDTGEALPGYPIALPGHAAVSSPALLLDLQQRHFLRRDGLGLDLSRGAGAGANAGANAGAGAGVASLLRRSAATTAISASSMRAPLLAADTAAEQLFPLDAAAGPAGAAGAVHESSASSMRGGQMENSLHLLVTSFEGHVYIIDGVSSDSSKSSSSSSGVGGALTGGREEQVGEENQGQQNYQFHAQQIDIGEHIYSMPLVEDITGDGYLDLLVGTLNGQLLLFESSLPFHPSNAWNSFPNFRTNEFTHGHDMGISIPAEEKEKLRQYDIKGSQNITITFDIRDEGYWRAMRSNQTEIREQEFRYTVSVTRGTNRLQLPLWEMTFEAPGRYQAYVPVSPPEMCLLVLSLTSDHGRYSEDAVYIALSTRFYIWIKYMLLAPAVLLCATLIARFRKYIL